MAGFFMRGSHFLQAQAAASTPLAIGPSVSKIGEGADYQIALSNGTLQAIKQRPLRMCQLLGSDVAA
jgi:hypothetical protein